MKRSILAGFAGMVAASVSVAVVEGIGHAVYPPPPGLDMKDPESIAKHVATLPIGALAFVVVAWIVGALVGNYIAAKITRPPSNRPSIVVSVLFFASCAANMFMIPPPAWFAIAAVLLVPAASVLGMRLGLMRKQ